MADNILIKITYVYLSWKVQYFTPSFEKNSKEALSLLFAFDIELEPSSHGRNKVGKPNGSAPKNRTNIANLDGTRVV